MIDTNPPVRFPLTIESNKPIPIPLANIYPFAKMEIGDSFYVDGKNAMRVTSAASVYGKRRKKKFTIRTEGDGKRCWRIE